MHRRRSLCLAFAAWVSLFAAFSSLCANQFPPNAPNDLYPGEYVQSPEPYVPGPGWLTEEPATVYAGPPGGDGWDVSYPFKYYPQGQAAAGESVYDPSFLPMGIADECFCAPPPCYLGTFYLEAIVLDRHGNVDSTDVIFNSMLNPVANTADLNLDTEAGVRLGVLLPGPTGNDWMFEYFGINAFQDAITRGDSFFVSDLFFGVRGFASTLTLEYESKLDSIEFSIRSRQTRRLAPLAGIRYVRLGEQLNSLSATNTGWFSDCDNDMFGFQFGCQGLLGEYGPWRLETTVKAGPYVNDIDIDLLARSAAGSEITRHVDYWHTAFVGDLRIGLVCRLGPRLNFRIGYQGLWLEGIAIAPNQVNNISFATGLESVDVSGVIYQGGYAGFDLSW